MGADTRSGGETPATCWGGVHVDKLPVHAQMYARKGDELPQRREKRKPCEDAGFRLKMVGQGINYNKGEPTESLRQCYRKSLRSSTGQIIC
jgi:hypothetical protein